MRKDCGYQENKLGDGLRSQVLKIVGGQGSSSVEDHHWRSKDSIPGSKAYIVGIFGVPPRHPLSYVNGTNWRPSHRQCCCSHDAPEKYMRNKGFLAMVFIRPSE